ncbi:MAG: acylphosphatase [bacterium]
MEEPAGRLRLRVLGRVQGVWFRASAREAARRLGLTGWVRNLPDGSVELVAEGGAEALEALRAWCRRGPPHAQGEEVRAEAGAATGEFSGFEVR